MFDLNRGSNHKSRDLDPRFETPNTAIWGKFLRFGAFSFAEEWQPAALGEVGSGGDHPTGKK